MVMSPAIDMTAEQRKTVLSLLSGHLPDTEAWVYGSRIRWTSRPESDLDMVVFATPEQARGVSDLCEAFEESNLPFRVDLFVWDQAPESFRKQIQREHVVLVTAPKDVVDRLFPWRKMMLDDCISINASTYSPKENWPFINYLDTGSITDNHISGTQHLVVGQDKIPSRARRKVRQGDIVYSTVRPNQRHFGLIKNVSDNFLASTGFSVLRGIDGIAHTGFIFRYLTQEQVIEHLHSIAENSITAYPSIKPSDLEQLALDLPPLPEQRAIAHILGTLDDRIELNRRMNETLEAMARALFKSWFVDFDPVRAKMEGRDTGLPKDIADLFPHRLADSELGEIPEGWAIFCLDELANHHTKSMAPFSHPETEFEHFSIPAYDAGQVPAIDRCGNIKSNKTVVPSDAVLLSKLNPEIPRVWMPDAPNGRGQISSTEFLAFTPRGPANRSLLFSLFTNVAFRAILQSMVTGTSKSHQRIPPKALKKTRVLSGTPVLFDAFDRLMAPVLVHVVKNRAKSHTLATLREALLPKLISGALRVRGKNAI